MNKVIANCKNEIEERFTNLSFKIQKEIDLVMPLLTPIKVPIWMPYYNENEDRNLGLIPPPEIKREEIDHYGFPDSIYESVKKTEEYHSIAQGANLNDPSLVLTEDYIKQFIFNIGEKLINKYDSNENIIRNIVKIFINDLYNRPIKAKTTIKLSGVDVSQLKVSLYSECSKITLRSVEKDDVIESINNKYINIVGLDMDRFSSIVEIEHDDDDINTEVNKMIALLRLYAVAGVNYNYYETKREIVIKRSNHQRGSDFFINSIEIPGMKSQRFSASVTDKNFSELDAHYHKLYEYLPDYIYNYKPINISTNVHHPSLKVAYRHYSDALIRGIDEKEIILNAVIGLESLLVGKASDNTFRFWLHGTKILSFFNYSPFLIKDILLQAYDVRSKFVHGNSHELEKALKKFDDINQNSDRFVSLTNLLECLRVLIILNVFMITKDKFIKKIENKNKSFKKEFCKEDFFKLINDSFIDRETNIELNEILKECQESFKINFKLTL